MRIYKCLIWWTSILTLLSLTVAIKINCCYGTRYDFEENIFLAIFGSAAITVLTSIITYFYERQKTLKNFLYHTVELIKFLNRYQADFSLVKKVQFYVDYYDLNKYMWDNDYGDIDFFFDRITKSRKYIYDSICRPIFDFTESVTNYVWDFRCYLDNSGKNDEVIKKYIEELESYLIKKVEKEIPVEYNEDNIPISYSKVKSFSPKLAKNISDELNGRYYTIMYGEKAKKRLTEDSGNGQT